MLPAGTGVRSQAARNGYVCLSCRTRTAHEPKKTQGRSQTRTQIRHASTGRRRELGINKHNDKSGPIAVKVDKVIKAQTTLNDAVPQRPRYDPNSTTVARSHPRSWRRVTFSSRLPGVSQAIRSKGQSRYYHGSTNWGQEASAAIASMPGESQRAEPDFFVTGHATADLDGGARTKSAPENPNGIRAQLRKWQELHGHEEEVVPATPTDDQGSDLYNGMGRLPDESIDSSLKNQDEQAKEENNAYFAATERMDKGGFEGPSAESTKHLKPGDLAELEYTNGRENTMAVFVRYLTSSRNFGQFFTLQGRWLHYKTDEIPFTIPAWVDTKELEPLVKYLPNPRTSEDFTTLAAQAVAEDLDAPREVTGPLVQKLVAFNEEVRQTYRRHSNALDNAHDYLAHETDLRYGSIVSAATALLKIPADQLPVAALFTVRKALVNGGFAFNIHRRSHRHTGYMQIRSKEQVRTVELVRDWIRQWQNDVANRAALDGPAAAKHRSPRGAQIVTNFIEKSKRIIAKQRQNRRPIEQRNISMSDTQLPFSKDVNCFRVVKDEQFTEEETNLVRFMESWSCSRMLHRHPRLESLPPLILAAMDLYHDVELGHNIGFLFLQELGVVMPWENRIRFDQHLLLPSSEHSKPLQNLMSSIMQMKDNHNFRDSMAAYRHDWLGTPVYCIDSASAHEIDDGISIEKAGIGPDGNEQHWLHIHIANPTAFFSRDHPLAKMARHMGETIYMPERAYMMLPRWSTQRHFSLAPNRPCLTFSAKVDSAGNITEEKITSGIIRNVIRLTYDEVDGILGDERKAESKWFDLFAGTDQVPPTTEHKSHMFKIGNKNRKDLQALHKIAVQVQEIRRRAGGIFFETDKPRTSVWHRSEMEGLPWTYPWRKGSRTTYGDPVIHVSTRALPNWFSVQRARSQVLVAESMLLCSKIAAKWCADRDIPIIFRGTARHPHVSEHVLAALRSGEELLRQGKELPMYMGIPYLEGRGTTRLGTSPIRHGFLGMDHYSKVTSPLRRYGDMIIHWQIEAALRQEAGTGKSLIVDPVENNSGKHDRSFLPFSEPILETIILGLHPRELMISLAKFESQEHWEVMLLQRKHIQKDNGGLPFDKLHMFVTSDPANVRMSLIPGVCVELNMRMMMTSPTFVGLDEPCRGDIWEVEITNFDIYNRMTHVKGVRLVERQAM